MRPYPESVRECPSDLRFDARFAGELSVADGCALDLHVAGCARCRARCEYLQCERERFLSDSPALVAAPGEPAIPRYQSSWLVPLAVLAVSAALLPLARRGEAPGPERSKGSTRIGFFIKRGEQVRRGIDGERVFPKDRLRFVYTSDEARRLLLLGIDGQGRVDVYWSRAVAAGQEQALPSAIELDDAPGDERVIALFCREPVDEGALRRELERTGELHTPPDCVRDDLTLSKIED